MGDHITLLGAEDVSRAGRIITGAADQMERAAVTIDEAMRRFSESMISVGEFCKQLGLLHEALTPLQRQQLVEEPVGLPDPSLLSLLVDFRDRAIDWHHHPGLDETERLQRALDAITAYDDKRSKALRDAVIAWKAFEDLKHYNASTVQYWLLNVMAEAMEKVKEVAK